MKALRTWLPWLIVALVALAAGAALTDPGGPGTEITLNTLRGETAIFRGSGLYRFDPVAVAREALIWDVINLALGVPALIVAAILAQCDSLRGRVAVAGFSLYFAYVYLMYATMSAFNPLFLVYVAVVALGIVNVVLQLSVIDIQQVTQHADPSFPRRSFMAYAFGTAGLLVLLWLARIVPILRTGTFPPELAGMATLETQAFDLGLVVPLMMMTGVLLWRRHAWGHVLAGVSVTFGVMLNITIPVWITAAMIRQGTASAVEGVPFFVISVAGLVMARLYFGAIREPSRVLTLVERTS